MKGFITNHSLQVSTATHIYEAGVDEQERTGHGSLDGVSTYKRTSQQQCQEVSSILNTAKKPKTYKFMPFSLHHMSLRTASKTSLGSFQCSLSLCLCLHHHHVLVPALVPRQSLILPYLPHFYFNSCPSVVINLNNRNIIQLFTQ